jgi:hypothetical protein
MPTSSAIREAETTVTRFLRSINPFEAHRSVAEIAGDVIAVIIS